MHTASHRRRLLLCVERTAHALLRPPCFCAQDAPVAESAKAKAAVQLLDKRPRQRLAERTAKTEEARFESAFRRSAFKLSTVQVKHVHRCWVRGWVGVGGLQHRSATWYLKVVHGPSSLTHSCTYLLTYSLTHVPTYVLIPMVRRNNRPTSTSHRFDSELNRLAAEMGCKGGEEGGNGLVLGQNVQARLPPYCAPARNQ
eukprot:scaffold11302_cov57-Phaeocystis_antarctica.AAC.3